MVDNRPTTTGEVQRKFTMINEDCNDYQLNTQTIIPIHPNPHCLLRFTTLYKPNQIQATLILYNRIFKNIYNHYFQVIIKKLLFEKEISIIEN